MTSNYGVKVGVLVAGGIQTIAVLLQAFHVIPSFSTWFAVSGTLCNPAYAAAHIVSGITVATAVLFFEYKVNRIWYVVPYVVLGLAALFICGSRSCILSYLIVLAYCLYGKYKGTIIGSWKIILPLCFLTTGVALVIGLYHVRPASADSRLLTWRVCWDLFLEDPIFGIGGGNLKYKYMFAQADYFSTRPDSPFVPIADNCFQSYSEPIRLICEHGLVGLAVCSSAAVFLYKQADKTTRALIISLLTVSCFLYTRDIISLSLTMQMIVLSILIQCLSKQKNAKLASVLICISLLVAPLCPIIKIVSKQDPTAYRDVPLPTYENVCDEGLVFQRAGDYFRAEDRFIVSRNMIPERLYAPFCLFQLYVETGDERAKVIAKEILDAEPRIYGDATITIKNTVRRWYECNGEHTLGLKEESIINE